MLVHGMPADEETIRANIGSHYLESFYNNDLAFCAVWERISRSTRLPAGKTVIFGHTPTKYFRMTNCSYDEPMRLWYGDHRIGIDCGCAVGRGGRLGCLRLDDMQEFYSLK